ncbi:flavin reductase family protein [Microbacterium protaetiae]|nr:flavin reductase family protein [Microbacterium protaetiae]
MTADPSADPSAATSIETHIVAHPHVLYVGTPAYLIASTNSDGTPNLAAASSHWALGDMLCLGLEAAGQTAQNIADRPGITVNFPSAPLWPALVRLSHLTGRHPVPADKSKRYRFEKDKFGAAQLTPQASELVDAPRVQECALQFEATVRRMTPGLDGGYFMVEAQVLRVHADPALVPEGTGEIDPRVWHPLIYAFRHFFDRGPEAGWLDSSRWAPPPVID